MAIENVRSVSAATSMTAQSTAAVGKLHTEKSGGYGDVLKKYKDLSSGSDSKKEKKDEKKRKEGEQQTGYLIRRRPGMIKRESKNEQIARLKQQQNLMKNKIKNCSDDEKIVIGDVECTAKQWNKVICALDEQIDKIHQESEGNIRLEQERKNAIERYKQNLY